MEWGWGEIWLRCDGVGTHGIGLGMGIESRPHAALYVVLRQFHLNAPVDFRRRCSFSSRKCGHNIAVVHGHVNKVLCDFRANQNTAGGTEDYLEVLKDSCFKPRPSRLLQGPL